MGGGVGTKCAGEVGNSLSKEAAGSCWPDADPLAETRVGGPPI